MMPFNHHPAARTFAVATLLATLIGASPVVAIGPTHATAKGKAGAADDVEVRIKTLRTKLRITVEQEPAWNDFAQTMRDNAARMKELRKTVQNDKSMSAVDQLNTYASVVDAHADGVHKLVPPFQKLYDTLSGEQKKTADAVFRERARAAAQRHKQ